MRVTVTIDVPEHTLAEYFADQSEWHPTGDESVIAIDKAYLRDDPKDDSFVLLNVVAVEP